MDFRENNYSLVRKKHPDLAHFLNHNTQATDIEIHTSKTGQKIPCFIGNGKKIFIHSRFDPEKEAHRFIAEVNTSDFDLFIVLGFGFAFHIQELLKTVSKNSQILVIEKNFDFIRKSVDKRDLTDVLSDNRVILLADPSEDDIASKMKGRASKSVTFVTHRGSYAIYPEYYNNMLQICRSYISTKEVNIATLAKFEKTWTSNISRNISRFISTPGINIFYDRFKGIPALVICAGPSLEKSLDFIKKTAKHVCWLL